LKFFKEMFKPNNKDIRKRIIFTLGALFVFILGIAIRVPGTSDITINLDNFEIFNYMSGGAFKQFSIFALGVAPYISASIAMSLGSEFIPYLSDLRDQGNKGRIKINKISRYLAIILAFVQGYVMSFTFLGNGASAIDYIYISVILTTGTSFLLWLGDQITDKGIGNGISLIIMAGIVYTLPNMFITAYNTLIDTATTQSTFMGIISFTLFVLMYVAVIVGVIYVQTAERRLPIQHANKTTSAYGGAKSYMPIKLNAAGVMPVIIASVIMSGISFLPKIISNETLALFVSKYFNYTNIIGFAIFALLIIAFTYVMTFIQLRPDKMAENLQKSGGYIPGIRPGNETQIYVKKVISRITLVGSLFLVIIVGMPILFTNFSGLPNSVSIGGTGLLIAVGVSLETFKQLEGIFTSRSYYGVKKWKI